MKEADLRSLESWGYDFHGCRRGPDGRCYYLASKEPESFGGDYRGRVFHAFAEAEGDDTPSQALELQFFVSRTALATERIRTLMGDYDTFIVRKGMEHVRRFLDQGLAPIQFLGGIGTEPIGVSAIGDGGMHDPNKHRIDLATNSPDEDFKVEPSDNVLQEQRDLSEEILRTMLRLHLETDQKRISREELLRYLCAAPNRVNRALRALEDNDLLEGVASGDLKLSPRGDTAAQNFARPASRNPTLSIQAQIDREREPGRQVLEEIRDVIEQVPDLDSGEDQPPGIGHNQPPEVLSEFQEVVSEGVEALGETNLNVERLTAVYSGLKTYRDIFLQKFSETLGEQAAKWFWRVLAVLVAHVIGIFERILALLEAAP